MRADGVSLAVPMRVDLEKPVCRAAPEVSILGALLLNEQRLPLGLLAAETFSPPLKETIVKNVCCTVIYAAAKDRKQLGPPPWWGGGCGGKGHAVCTTPELSA